MSINEVPVLRSVHLSYLTLAHKPFETCILPVQIQVSSNQQILPRHN